jgi:hypothetical protein
MIWTQNMARAQAWPARIHANPDFPKLLRSEWRKLLPELGHRGNPAGISIHFKIDQHRHLQRSVPSKRLSCCTACVSNWRDAGIFGAAASQSVN